MTVLHAMTTSSSAIAEEMIITGKSDNNHADAPTNYSDGIVILNPKMLQARRDEALVWLADRSPPPPPGSQMPRPDDYMPARRAQFEEQRSPIPSEAKGSPPDNGLVEKEKERIILAGIRVANRMDTTFRCAAGVQLALQEAGHPEFLGSGNGWEMRYAFLNSPKWRVTDDPNKATAFVRAWTDEVVQSYGDRYQGRNLGHVGLIFRHNDRLIELSDHQAVHHPYSSRYARTIYFEYVG